jgi:hypothetical protein
VNASLLAVLNDDERLLVAQTQPAQVAPLDEDEAVELHERIRRARNSTSGTTDEAPPPRLLSRAAVARHGRRIRDLR